MIASVLFFLKRVGFFVIDHWKIVLPAVLILIVGVWFMRACNKPPKLDEKAIQKAEQAVKERNDAVLKEILVEADVKEKQIDANLANAENEKLKALDEARKKYNQMTTDELAKAIEERK